MVGMSSLPRLPVKIHLDPAILLLLTVMRMDAMGVFPSHPALLRALLAWDPVPGTSAMALATVSVTLGTPSPKLW